MPSSAADGALGAVHTFVQLVQLIAVQVQAPSAAHLCALLKTLLLRLVILNVVVV